MPSERRFSAVLFDLDGVLVDSEALAAGVWVALLSESGLWLSPEAFMAQAVGRTHRALLADLEREHGWRPPEGFLEALDERLLAAFAHTPALPGALDTLRALRDAGLPYAVASNSERGRLRRKLGAAGLAPWVGERAYDPAHVGGYGKPAPDLYRYAAAQLGVPAQTCLVVEDTLTGVQAGRAAGATVWGLVADTHHDPDAADTLSQGGAEKVLFSHAELRAALGL